MKKVIRINKKEYRKRKIIWFEKAHIIREKEFRQREKEFRERKREFDLFRMRAQLDMELTRIRITKEKMEYAIDKVKANERDEEKLKEYQNLKKKKTT